ncbi:MAG: hypothetical protein AB8B55_07190 [Mariniblastus sp.]
MSNQINTEVKAKLKPTLLRRLLTGMMLAVALSTSTGCFLPIYDADPAVRARQLIYTSEDLRALRDEWTRFWFLDQPDHMTPLRTHGGIL